MTRNRHPERVWETRLSWPEFEAEILALLGQENDKARTGKRPFPDADLAWAAIRLLRKAQAEGIGSLLPVDQAWLRELRSRFQEGGRDELIKALGLDRSRLDL
jgi:hypothetical protein